MANIDISVVVPAYNEESRIKPFIKDLGDFTKKIKNYEVIFVDDGSMDGTLKILSEYSKSHKNTRIIAYPNNMGKGYAVRRGVMDAKGKKIIFIDADGSIKPIEIIKMQKLLDEYDVVVGNRVHYESKVQQPIIRKTTGKMFNFYVNTLFGIHVQDNLCGFKGFRADIGKNIFSKLISKRWIFDVEVFYRVRKDNRTMIEMPIEWAHREGTKIKFFDPFKMFFQLASLRIKISRSA